MWEVLAYHGKMVEGVFPAFFFPRWGATDKLAERKKRRTRGSLCTPTEVLINLVCFEEKDITLSTLPPRFMNTHGGHTLDPRSRCRLKIRYCVALGEVQCGKVKKLF